MTSHIPWLVTVAWVLLGSWLPGFASAQRVAARPPANDPIVLHYHETPIFLGPHEHNVMAVAYSSDGKTIGTGATDGYLRLWDAATGNLKSIHGEDATRGVHGLAISPDGRLVAVVGALFGKQAVLWDTSSGRIARNFEEPTGSVDNADAAAEGTPFIYKGRPINYRVQSAVAFSPDGKLLATADEGVLLRDPQSGSIAATLKHPAKRVKALAFSTDGKTLATAAEDRKVRLWSVPDKKVDATLSGPMLPISAVAISPDDARVAAVTAGIQRPGGGRDLLAGGQLWVWDRSAGKGRKIELGKRAATSLAFVSPMLVIAGAGKDVLIVDLKADRQSAEPRVLSSHSDDVLTLAVSPDGRRVASGGRDRTVDVVDVASGRLVFRLPGLNDIVTAVAASPDGRHIATASGDVRFSNRIDNREPSFAARHKEFFSGELNASRCQPSALRIWSTEHGRLQSSVPLPTCQVTAIDYIPGSELVAVAGWTAEKGGTLSVWDTTSGEQVRVLTSQGGEVLSVAASPDGRTLASGDADGNLNFWDFKSGSRTRRVHHDFRLEAVVFSADGKHVACGGDRAAVVYETSSGKSLHTLKSRSRIEALDFSPDASLLAAGTRVPGLELWDLRGGTSDRTLKAPGDENDFEETRAGYVAFSPDGRFVVCGGHGKDIAVFDVAKGTLHRALKGHSHPATAIAFLPDGRMVSGGEERTVRLWDLNLGKWLATWVAWPADQKQHWADEWIGYTQSGQFTGSSPLARLVGWQVGGETLIGPEDGQNRRKVDRLFQVPPSVSTARD